MMAVCLFVSAGSSARHAALHARNGWNPTTAVVTHLRIHMWKHYSRVADDTSRGSSISEYGW